MARIDSNLTHFIDLDGPPTVTGVAASGLPINLPWFPKNIPLGTALHSSRLRTANPWGEFSPFDAFSLQNSQIRSDVVHGSSGSFVSSTTTTKGQMLDHMSLSLGVSVDLLFAGASVVGSYDQKVTTNTSGLKSSIRSKFFYGSVVFDTPPRLSMSALVALKHPAETGRGLEEFQEQFGDYYVAGYRLGGESGMVLTQSTTASGSVEIKALEAKVKVLCFGATHHEEWIKSSSSSTARFDIVAYDTLDHTMWPPPLQEKSLPHPEQDELRAKQFGARVQGLTHRVTSAMRSLGLEESTLIGLEECHSLCESGLVMELILLPTRYLRQVMEWATNDNII